MIFTDDQQFADLVFSDVKFLENGQLVKLKVDQDVADGATALQLEGVASFCLDGLWKQNVIDTLQFARGRGAAQPEFDQLTLDEGHAVRKIRTPEPMERLLFVILVPANGAIIYASCSRIAKLNASGACVYEVNAE